MPVLPSSPFVLLVVNGCYFILYKIVIISANKTIPFVSVELHRPESYDALKVSTLGLQVPPRDVGENLH